MAELEDALPSRGLAGCFPIPQGLKRESVRLICSTQIARNFRRVATRESCTTHKWYLFENQVRQTLFGQWKSDGDRQSSRRAFDSMTSGGHHQEHFWRRTKKQHQVWNRAELQVNIFIFTVPEGRKEGERPKNKPPSFDVAGVTTMVKWIGTTVKRGSINLPGQAVFLKSL